MFKTFIEENVRIFQLPSAKDLPKNSFIPAYEENTYQANFFMDPSERHEDGETFIWLPRSFFENRVMPQFGGILGMFEKSHYKKILGACQYLVKGDTIEIIYMATRRGWKKQNIMSILIEAIKQEHGLSKLEYWKPTDAGKKFAKKKSR